MIYIDLTYEVNNTAHIALAQKEYKVDLMV